MVEMPLYLAEIHHIALGKYPNDRSMDHSSQDTGGIFDGLSTAELNIIGCEK